MLLHISSLPGEYGIGTLGAKAYQFVDFLQAAGQSFWQVLPVCPTGYGDSPYQSFSCEAGNPYFIDLPRLTGQGLLEENEYADICWGRKRRMQAPPYDNNLTQQKGENHAELAERCCILRSLPAVLI